MGVDGASPWASGRQMWVPCCPVALLPICALAPVVQEKVVRELAEADEEGRDPGEKNEGLLVPTAQPPKERQDGPIIIQEQGAAGPGGRRRWRRKRQALDLSRQTPCRGCGCSCSRRVRLSGRQRAVFLRQLPASATLLSSPVYRHPAGEGGSRTASHREGWGWRCTTRTNCGRRRRDPRLWKPVAIQPAVGGIGDSPCRIRRTSTHMYTHRRYGGLCV